MIKHSSVLNSVLYLFVSGFEQKEECDEIPVQKCSLSTANVEKHSPRTECAKVNETLCAPRGCGHKEVGALIKMKINVTFQ